MTTRTAKRQRASGSKPKAKKKPAQYSAASVAKSQPGTIYEIRHGKQDIRQLTFRGGTAGPHNKWLVFSGPEGVDEHVEPVRWDEDYAAKVVNVIPPNGEAVAGVCRVCSCTEENACEGGCSWADETKTICDRCVDTEAEGHAGVCRIAPAEVEGDTGVKQMKRAQAPTAKTVMVRIGNVTVRDNPRQDFSEDRLFELRDSLVAHGQLQPIVLDMQGEEMVLIAGERRLRAAKSAGDEFIEARVYRDLGERQAAGMQLAENFQRVDLNHVETARALGKARDAGSTVAEICAAVHKSADYVREHLDLLRLHKDILALIASGRLPIKQAAMIARVGDQQAQVRLSREVIPVGSDYVMPLGRLRQLLSYRLRALGGCHWPMDAEYAKRRPCIGCPDNAATEPALFEGVNLPGKSKKGNCTNAGCLAAKAKAWEKDPAKKARDKKLAETKAKRQANAAADGKGKPAKETTPKEKERPWPDTPEERLAVALWAWGQKVKETLVDQLEHGLGESDVTAILVHIMANCGEAVVSTSVRYDEEPKRLRALATELMDRPNAIKASAEIHACIAKGALRLDEWGGPSKHQPKVDEHELAMMDVAEALAKRWGVEIPEQPTLASVQAETTKAEFIEAVRASSKKGDDLSTTIAKCDDAALLTAAAETKGLAKYKQQLLAARLKALAGDGQPPAPADSTAVLELIRTGKKAVALLEIKACTDAKLLRTAQAGGLKGDWRRAAVATRIEQLAANSKAAAG